MSPSLLPRSVNIIAPLDLFFFLCRLYTCERVYSSTGKHLPCGKSQNQFSHSDLEFPPWKIRMAFLLKPSSSKYAHQVQLCTVEHLLKNTPKNEAKIMILLLLIFLMGMEEAGE